MFKIVIWNCHGLGNFSTCNWLKGLILREKVEYIGLIEPITNQKKVEELNKELSMGYYWSNPTNKI